MNAFGNTKDTFLDLSKLSVDKVKTLFDFYDFLLFKRTNEKDNPVKDIKKIPEIFYQPTKIDNYQVFDRNEVYGEK